MFLFFSIMSYNVCSSNRSEKNLVYIYVKWKPSTSKILFITGLQSLYKKYIQSLSCQILLKPVNHNIVYMKGHPTRLSRSNNSRTIKIFVYSFILLVFKSWCKNVYKHASSNVLFGEMESSYIQWWIWWRADLGSSPLELVS